MKVCKIILTLLCIAVSVVFLHCENKLTCTSLVNAFFLYFFSSAIHLSVHECGHFIGGVVSGYSLLWLQLGPISITVGKNNRVSVFWKASLSGQCIMQPKRIENIRFKAYNMGGIIANEVLIFLSIALLLLNSFLTSLLFVDLICIGIKKVIINTLPHKTNSVPNDGYIIKILKRDKATQKDYAMYLKLYGKLLLNEDITPQDFMYEREETEDENELLYYKEIQCILSSLLPGK